MSPELERDVLVCALHSAKERLEYGGDLFDQDDCIRFYSWALPERKRERKEWQDRAERLQRAIEVLDASSGQPRCMKCGGPAFLPDEKGVSAILTTRGTYCNKCGTP